MAWRPTISGSFEQFISMNRFKKDEYIILSSRHYLDFTRINASQFSLLQPELILDLIMSNNVNINLLHLTENNTRFVRVLTKLSIQSQTYLHCVLFFNIAPFGYYWLFAAPVKSSVHNKCSYINESSERDG